MTGRHRVSVRFASTLIGNLFRLGASFLSGLIIARGLGPASYGQLAFLLATFAAAASLFDMGSSSAFYTFISRRPRRPRFYGLYLAWMAAQAVLLAALVLALPAGAGEKLWLSRDRGLLLLALSASFLSNQAWRMVQHIAESARETVRLQVLWLAISAADLTLMAAAAALGRLGLHFVLWAGVFEYAAAIAVFAAFFDWGAVVEKEGAQSEDFLGPFWRYCRPLILAGWAGFLFNYADRWLLERFAGPVQQAFLALGQQFAVVGLLGASSLVNILWKELAEAGHKGDRKRAELLFLTTTRSVYFAAAAITGFVLPFSRDLLAQAMGPRYQGAWPAFAVLTLFPLHQSIGQVVGACFQAEERTNAYTAFVVLAAALGVPLGYLVLAPRGALVPGLGLQATALAVKLVVVQALLINLQGLYLCRVNGWRWPLAHQLVTPLLLIGAGFLSFHLGAALLPGGGRLAFAGRLAAAAVAYLALVGVLARSWPALTGLPREKINDILARLRSYAPALSS